MGGAWVRAIDEVFDAAWLREQVDGRHLVSRAMSWDTPSTIVSLAAVADLVLAARAATSGAEPIVKRLRVHEDFVATSFEARVARWVAGEGLAFRFADATGASAADIHVEGSPAFEIEVKHVKNAERSALEDALTDLVPFDLFFVRPEASLFRFDWSGAEVQAPPLDEFTMERRLALVARVCEVLYERLRAASKGDSLEVTIEGVATVRVMLDAPPDRTSFGIDTAWRADRNPRRLAKQLIPAASQLDRSRAGIVVLAVEPGIASVDRIATHAREVFETRGSAWDHVSGAIVVVATPGHWEETSIPIANPHATVTLASLRLQAARAARHVRRFDDVVDLVRWPDAW